MTNKLKVTTIDGVKYINKYHYDKLEKSKVKIVKEEIKPEFCNKDYHVSDPANVCAIMPVKEVSENTHEIKAYFGRFKEVTNPEITYYHNENFDIDCFKVENIKFSKEYLEQMQKMAKVWFDKVPRIFLMVDDKDKFIDGPGIFIFGNKLVFALAPRIEND